jgi:hypothetical protein
VPVAARRSCALRADGTGSARAELPDLHRRRADARDHRLPHRVQPRSRPADQRRLALSVTQKGLNRLQDWINSATDTGTPIVKSVAVVARDQQQNVLARWEFTEVQPATLASTGQGQLTEVTATIEFSYSTFKQTQAKPD